MKTFELNARGVLSVKDDGEQTDIQPSQIAAFRRDPDFEAELPADIRAILDAGTV